MLEQRQTARQSSTASVRYEFKSRTRKAVLANLSFGGCMLALGGEVLVPGEPIIVTLLESVSVSGSIVWQQGSLVGVEFDELIGEALVRFFGYEGPSPENEHAHKDGFGRDLPPMRGLT